MSFVPSSNPPPTSRYSPTPPPHLPFPSPSSSSSHHAVISPTRISNSSAANQPKRKQVKNACVNCQKACKKCDDQRPCSRCVKYGIEEGCINSQRKERKRKSDYSLDSARDRPQMSHDHFTRAHTPASSSTSSRLLVPRPPARTTIRPFPKELLESLQSEADDIDYPPVVGADHLHLHLQREREREREREPEKTETVLSTIRPQVTEEFKTLAQICSDLHTILFVPQPSPPVYYNHQQQSNHPSSSCQQQQHVLLSARPTSPIVRSALSPLKLLKPSSPFFNHHHSHRNTSNYVDPAPVSSSNPVSPSLTPIHPHSFYSHLYPVLSHSHQRDVLNRTPLEDEDENSGEKHQK